MTPVHYLAEGALDYALEHLFNSNNVSVTLLYENVSVIHR